MKYACRIAIAFATTSGTCCFYSVSLHAEETPADAVVVTATRTAQTADDTLAAVSVITREDIERSQARTVTELLLMTPGADAAVNGGYGKTTALLLRGTNPSHTLLLIDGVKAGSATAGTVPWEYLPVSEIDRIEIVRGPRSSLYGSEAIGGVIQIFTRKGSGPVTPRAEIMAGSHSTNEVSAGISGSDENTWFNVHGGRFATRGINAYGPALQYGIMVDEPDDDGYHNRYGSLRIGRRLAADTEVEFNLLHSQGNTEFDSANVPPFAVSNNEEDFLQNTLGLTLRHNITKSWRGLFQLGQHRDELYDFSVDRNSTPSRFNTKRRTFSWQNDVVLSPNHLLTLGYDKQREYVESTAVFSKTQRDNDAVFGQYQTRISRHDFQISLRHDDNEQFGQHNTGNLAYGFDATQNARIIASYGTAFHAPTFNDLYFPPFFGMPTSNPDLLPEESRTREAGVVSKYALGKTGIRVFRTTIRNMIALDANFVPQNLNHATIDGIETEGSVRLGNSILGGSVTFLDPRDDQTSNLLQRRSRRSANLNVDHRFDAMEIGVGVLSQSPRYDDSANTVRLGGYSTVNLRARYWLTKPWSVQGRIDNALDKQYETVANYHPLGRSYYVSLRYQPSQRDR